ALDAGHESLLTPSTGAGGVVRRRARPASPCAGVASVWDASWSGCGSCTRGADAAGPSPSAGRVCAMRAWISVWACQPQGSGVGGQGRGTNPRSLIPDPSVSFRRQDHRHVATLELRVLLDLGDVFQLVG